MVALKTALMAMRMTMALMTMAVMTIALMTMAMAITEEMESKRRKESTRFRLPSSNHCCHKMICWINWIKPNVNMLTCCRPGEEGGSRSGRGKLERAATVSYAPTNGQSTRRKSKVYWGSADPDRGRLNEIQGMESTRYFLKWDFQMHTAQYR